MQVEDNRGKLGRKIRNNQQDPRKKKAKSSDSQYEGNLNLRGKSKIINWLSDDRAVLSLDDWEVEHHNGGDEGLGQ